MRVLALVLAGGHGHRFWPRSSEALPKQFLNLFGDESLLQATVRRLSLLLPLANIYVLTTAAHEHLARLQLPQVPDENVIAEPMARDTAAAIGYASGLLGEKEADSVAIVVPSDHFIADEDVWGRTLTDAARAAASGVPVLIGLRPTRPETTYGYILLSDEAAAPSGATTRFFRVARFIEKPGPDLAQRLISADRCLWNSGIFVWKISTVMDLIRRNLPETYSVLTEITRMKSEPGGPSERSPAWRAKAATLFAGIKPVSIDYGVLEKTENVIVALGEFKWDDVGSWEALARLYPGDKKRNVAPNGAILQDAEECIIDWPEGPAVIVGIKDAVVAGYAGRLLVCSRDRLGELKALLGSREFGEMAGSARRAQRGQLPASAKVTDKPWGRETLWLLTNHYAAKILEVFAGQKTSLHLHKRKRETLYFHEGSGRLRVGDETVRVLPATTRTIEPGTPHRIYAFTDLTVFEVSTPEMDDTVRLEDDYGRSIGDYDRSTYESDQSAHEFGKDARANGSAGEEESR